MEALFTDMELLGADQGALFEVADVLGVKTAPQGPIVYGDEPGVIDLFGVGQLAIVGV